MSNWLEQLKPGNKVIIDGRSKSICTVSRVTKTQIVVNVENYIGNVYEEKFAKRNGYKVGASAWDTTCIREATPQAVAALQEAEKREKAKHTIREANLAKLSTDQLVRIVAILKEQAAE